MQSSINIGCLCMFPHINYIFYFQDKMDNHETKLYDSKEKNYLWNFPKGRTP